MLFVGRTPALPIQYGVKTLRGTSKGVYLNEFRKKKGGGGLREGPGIRV